MKNSLEHLYRERKEKDAAVRKYEQSLLDCKISDVVEFCFNEAAKWSYNPETLQNFRRYLEELGGRLGVIPFEEPVECLLRESTLVIERLLKNTSLSDMQKKLRMHALIFLYRFLERETGGTIRTLQMPPELAKISPAREERRAAATYEEVQAIFLAAKSINIRDCLILKLIYHTECSLQDILKLQCDALNYEDRIITGVNYIIDTDLMIRLKDYVESTAKIRGVCPYVFISNQGKPLYRTQIQKTLDKANAAAQLPFRITTKMIQRSHQSEKINRET